MKVEKNKLKNDNDLQFTPLNISSPLNLNTPNMNSLNTLNPFDGISINSDCNNIYIGFPPLGINASHSNTSNMPNTSNSTSNNTTSYTPLMPYPNNIPSMDMSNSTNLSNQNLSDYEYPSEMSSEDLYSYNSKKSGMNNFNNNNSYNSNNSNNNNSNNSNYNSSTNNTSAGNSTNQLINPVDILRNFDLSIYEEDSRDSYSNKEIDEIFEDLKNNNPGIFSTLKAYRVPYPIATLLVKKIIKITLKHK